MPLTRPAPGPSAPPPRRAQPRTTRMRIVAADPSVEVGGQPLTAVVEVPAEHLSPGPRGYRVHVVDYDASSRALYPPAELEDRTVRWLRDPEAPVSRGVIEGDPRFHARNVYALVMRTLTRFEFALGRRVSWAFASGGHQLKVAPHAFCEPNAFYSRRDEALFFGHFPAASGRTVFTCLSHDIVVHETAHALLDGLRDRYTAPSSVDQAAFHEGFADVVALLSVFSLEEVVGRLLDVGVERARSSTTPAGELARADATVERLRASTLFAVGRELGRELSPIGRSALRHSLLDVAPSPQVLRSRVTPHERGEVLVAAVMDAFVRSWAERLAGYLTDRHARTVSRARAAEEGARCASELLTMVIRALDYAPPVHLEFGAWLSAMVTADEQLRPRDTLGLRRHLVAAFAAWGLRPASRQPGAAWAPLQDGHGLSVERVRFEAMQHDVDEVFRFAWENRQALGLFDQAFTRVLSVRPCVRAAPEDGFTLRETVAEVLQQVELRAGDLHRHGVRQPRGLPDSQKVMLYGGKTLVFDEYGRLRYAIGDAVLAPGRDEVQRAQSRRVEEQWRGGGFRPGARAARRFSAVHHLRSWGQGATEGEVW